MPSPPRTPSRLQRVIYTLRTEGGSRGREAWAIALGLCIGCSPLIGFHLGLCMAAGWLFGLNRLKLYVAANLINPLIIPAVLFTEVQAGAWLRHGALYPLSVAAFRTLDPWRFGLDLALGSVIVGGVIGGAGGGLTYWLLGRRFRDPAFAPLVRKAADRYLGVSITAWEFARAKLRSDPVYRRVVSTGWLPGQGHLVDVGCGQGLFLALVAEARAAALAGTWPGEWGAPPVALTLSGIELRPRVADVARHAVGDVAAIETGDARQVDTGSADVITIFDVLHLIDAESQLAILDRLAAALRPGGVLLLREADASAGWRFQMVRAGNWLTAMSQRRWGVRFAFRTGEAWAALLRGYGLAVEERPMGDGTPFANVLLIARKAGRARPD
jgi:uncharacterized protein (DUF2062 family)/SAM-dependent methyltransferase